MEYSIYQGMEFCSFSLKDSNGYYHEEFRKKMRKESQGNAFTCPECGEYVILNAGPTLPPYFSHHKGSNCSYQNNGESKEHREGRFLLYLLAKKSYPTAVIKTNYVHDNQKRSHVYIDLKNAQIALNYITTRIIIKDWEEKHEYYRQNKIKDIWILSKASNINVDSKNISLNSYLTSQVSNNNTIHLLDTINKTFTIVKFLPKSIQHLNNKSSRIFEQKTYPLNELSLDRKGEFHTLYKNEVGSKMVESNITHNKSKIQEEHYKVEYKQLSLWEKDNDTIKEDTIKEDIIKEDIIKDDTIIEDKIMIERTCREEKKLVKEKSHVKDKNIVKEKNTLINNTNKRCKIIEHAILLEPTKNTFLFKSTNTFWELPMLIGTNAEIKVANAKRLDYFIVSDQEILLMKDHHKKKEKIQDLVDCIEKKLYAKDWGTRSKKNGWR